MTTIQTKRTHKKAKASLLGKGLWAIGLLMLMSLTATPLSAQSLLRRADSILSQRYYNSRIDTLFIVRPQTKWTLRTRLNFSGARIETEGIENGQKISTVMVAQKKTTISVGATYLGVSLYLALNPAKLFGKYHDYELNINSYGRKFGFDVIYHDAKNFTGHYDQEGMERIDLPKGILKVRTLNLNAYYAFNHRRFAYPAAFTQSYIQRRSAGSFLVAASAMWQHAAIDESQAEGIPEDQRLDGRMVLRMMNVGIGGGYGYNIVPGKGWLIHLSALPTFIVYSNASLKMNDERAELRYHFPEFIVTTRSALVYQWKNKFLGLSMVYNYTNVGHRKTLSVENSKWRLRAFFGFRL